MKKFFMGAVLVLSLSGCAETAARLANDAADLHISISNYVRENHDLRREIRKYCWELVKLQARLLESRGEFGMAIELLKKNYPKPVTVEIVTDALNNPEELLSEPFGCEQ